MRNNPIFPYSIDAEVYTELVGPCQRHTAQRGKPNFLKKGIDSFEILYYLTYKLYKSCYNRNKKKFGVFVLNDGLYIKYFLFFTIIVFQYYPISFLFFIYFFVFSKY